MVERYTPLKKLERSLYNIILLGGYYSHPEELTRSQRSYAQRIANDPAAFQRYVSYMRAGLNYLIDLTYDVEKNSGVYLFPERNNLQAFDRGLQRIERNQKLGTLHFEDVYNFAIKLQNLTKKVEARIPKQKLIPEATETVAIVLISIIGLASFLYTQSGPTARLVSPTIINLPLGISLLAILVIAIMAISRR